MAWLYGYPNVITGCLEVYAINIAAWSEQVLDRLKVMKFCLNAHGMDALILICPRFIGTCTQLHAEGVGEGRISQFRRRYYRPHHHKRWRSPFIRCSGRWLQAGIIIKCKIRLAFARMQTLWVPYYSGFSIRSHPIQLFIKSLTCRLRARRANVRAVHAPKHSIGRQDQARRVARVQVSRLGHQATCRTRSNPGCHSH